MSQSRSLFPIIVIAFALDGAGMLSAEGLAVAGFDRARILAPAGAAVTDYRNAGYRLTARDGEVRIEIDASPVRSTSAFSPPRRPRFRDADPIGRLAWGLTSDSATHYEAVSRILGWMSRNVEYRLDREAPQDAMAVLERRSAYCTGVARLAVALLWAAGIEAREVAGWVAGEGAPGRSEGYHRWIEAYLPDRGWVFSDPLASHHFVPATYVRLASDHLWEERGLGGLLLERDARTEPVDLYPAAGRGIVARRNWPRQLAAALRLEIAGATPGQAWLVGERVQRHGFLSAGSLSFVGLEPGRYRLLLQVQGADLIDGHVELPDRVPSALRLALDRVAGGIVAPHPSNRRGRTSR